MIKRSWLLFLFELYGERKKKETEGIFSFSANPLFPSSIFLSLINETHSVWHGSAVDTTQINV